VRGKVSYAVLSFGGFFGIGDDYYPLPWPSLKYNVELGGYQTMITKDQLRKAPRYARSSDWNWNDQQLARSVSAWFRCRSRFGLVGTVQLSLPPEEVSVGFR
jgi:hypothetical protein